jgi:hypothetical protein
MPDKERRRHAHPDAGILIVAAPSETGGTLIAVTDGDGIAYMLRASNRRYVLPEVVVAESQSPYTSG